MTEVKKELTKDLLTLSFKELIMKMPFEKITVKMITDGADVIRPTFYKHFQDKYELLEWIIDTQLIAPAEPLIQNGMVNEALVLLFSNIEKEKEFYQKASRLEGQNSFESIAQSCIMKVFLRVFERSAATKKPKYVWLTPERIAAYYAQSMCYIVMNWIQSGMTISARELAEIYDYIIKRSMEDILAEL